MNWLIAKQILQKVWFYIKNYWWVGALIALGFVLHKFFLFDKDVLGGLYEEKAKQNETLCADVCCGDYYPLLGIYLLGKKESCCC